jgi:hypothetical protein
MLLLVATLVGLLLMMGHHSRSEPPDSSTILTRSFPVKTMKNLLLTIQLLAGVGEERLWNEHPEWKS